MHSLQLFDMIIKRNEKFLNNYMKKTLLNFRKQIVTRNLSKKTKITQEHIIGNCKIIFYIFEGFSEQLDLVVGKHRVVLESIRRGHFINEEIIHGHYEAFGRFQTGYYWKHEFLK